MATSPRFSACGVGALLMDVAPGTFDLATQQRLWSLCAKGSPLHQLAGVRQLALGVNNLLVVFDPFAVQPQALREALEQAWAQAKPLRDSGRLIEIPVTYDMAAQSDLAELACRTGLGPDEIVALHTSVDYHVACIGFLPGFAFMVGLPPQLVMPRRAAPRLKIPAGSVGIGGAQTGVIPLEVPSGWNLLGRTDLQLFDPQKVRPCLLAAGDRVRFTVQGRHG